MQHTTTNGNKSPETQGQVRVKGSPIKRPFLKRQTVRTCFADCSAHGRIVDTQVIGDLLEVALLVDNNRLVSALKHVANPAMSPVEALCIDSI
jgi:hypothetical protein